MESIEEKYEFYLKHVPRSTSTLFGHSSTELDRIRKEVIRSHRIISLSSILTSEKKEIKSKYGFSKSIDSPHKFVLNPLVLDPSISINPLLVHQTTSLFNLIHSNTSDLVDALLKYKKLIPAFSSFSLVSFNDSDQNSESFLFKTSSSSLIPNSLKEFNFLALSAIPALFGFYSSNEHINLSMGFFVKLFNSTDCLPLVLPFLSPFFSAPCLYRFFESSLSPFFDWFVRDTQKFNDDVINEYSQKLTHFFISSAPLVPHTHVVLLRLMHAKWGEHAACFFFCEILLKKHIFQWLESVSTKIPKEFEQSNKSKSKIKNKNKDICEGDLIAREIIECIFKNLDQSKILHSVLNTESLIEVPFQYTVFEDPFLYFLVSISDIRALYHLFMKESHRTLNSMKIIDTEVVNENAVYWVKTYPPHQMETQLTRTPLIFKNDEFKVSEDEVKERRWRAIENLADEREVDPMQIVKEMNDKKRRDSNLQSQILQTEESKNISSNDDFTLYALSMSLANFIESSEIFEQFLLQMYNLSSSKHWQKISIQYEYIIFLPIVKEMVIKKEKKMNLSNIDATNFKDQSINLFLEASKNLQSPTIKRYQYLFIIQRIIPKILKGSEQDFDIINEKVTEFFQINLSLHNSLNPDLDSSRSSIFWEAVFLFKTMQCNDLPYLFTNLMRGLSLIDNLSINTKINYNYNDENSSRNDNDKIDDDLKEHQVMKFLQDALSLSYSDRIFYLYMVISLFGMSDDQFRCLCTEQEHRLWIIFQKLILNIIINEEVSSEKYTAIINRFNQA
ncbi:hypothetical protein M9Y10_019310 [Tritrichomonas musculus]|uniref:Rab-GAP TBC domain-containing protein n=1 Tax=Tritrichomonas musculus TaxID=1915356 RepID=A0ABR2HJ52_9EUKA